MSRKPSATKKVKVEKKVVLKEVTIYTTDGGKYCDTSRCGGLQDPNGAGYECAYFLTTKGTPRQLRDDDNNWSTLCCKECRTAPHLLGTGPKQPLLRPR